MSRVDKAERDISQRRAKVNNYETLSQTNTPFYNTLLRLVLGHVVGLGHLLRDQELVDLLLGAVSLLHEDVLDGLASLDDVEQELDIEFGDVEMETLNGYLTELLGHIPSREDLDKEIVANGYRFKILSLGNRTIGRVRAEKINDKETKGESEKCQDIQNSQT